MSTWGSLCVTLFRFCQSVNFCLINTFQERTYQARITDLESQLSQARAEIAKVRREKEEVKGIF